MSPFHILFVSAHEPNAVIRDDKAWHCSVRDIWGALFDALKQRGAEFELRSFHDSNLTANSIAQSYTHVIFLTAEYYHDYVDAFEDFISLLAAARVLNPKLRVLNPAEAVLWNLEKGYLNELRQGLDHGKISCPPGTSVRLPQTTFLPRQENEKAELAQIIAHLQSLPADMPVFVKPTIAASSHGAFLVRHPDEQTSDIVQDLTETCAITHSNGRARVMVQEFLSNITSTETHGGEWGVYMVAGRPSHVTSRRPGPGDTRTGEDFGGGGSAVPLSDAPPVAVAAATAIWQWLAKRFDNSADLLYVRIDGILGGNGEFVILELEMIEPWFWFGTEASRDAPGLLCDAILGKETVETKKHTNTNGFYGSLETDVNGTHEASKPTALSGLMPTTPDDVHDMVCVGFGPANLALAAALHDRLRESSEMRPPKVVFFEKQSEFAWHSGMLLPGTRMQIPFIKDIATPRDPQSQFTFMNYLHHKGRLIDFSNLSTLYPSRAEFADYLKWCSSFFDDVVRYSSKVLSVEKVSKDYGSPNVTLFDVTVEQSNGHVASFRTRKVVVGLGGQASIPRPLSLHHPRILHSSEFSHLGPALISQFKRPRVAVIGGGQSAAEILDLVQSTFAASQTFLITREEFLKPSDDSPFVNEVFNPEFVDDFYYRSAIDREYLLHKVHSANYSVVNLDLIERIYHRRYEQKLVHGSNPTNWPHKFLSSREIIAVDAQGPKAPLVLQIRRRSDVPSTSFQSAPDIEEVEVDVIIAATGYRRNAHLDILAGTKSLWQKDSDFQDSDQKPLISRDYQLQFAPGAVKPGSGVWLQGCCEESHGISDTLLSVVASRSERVLNSMFANLSGRSSPVTTD